MAPHTLPEREKTRGRIEFAATGDLFRVGKKGLIQVNTEGQASVLWAGSSMHVECHAVLELVSNCECQDHPNIRIGGIQCQCQIPGLNTNIQTGYKSYTLY